MFEPTIRTGRERLRIFFRILLFLAGSAIFLVVGAAIAAFVTGRGLQFPDITWRTPLAGEGNIFLGGRHWQWPLLVHFDFPIWHAALGGLPLIIVWFLVLRIRSRRRRYPGDPSDRGFAKLRAIRKVFGRRHVRKTGSYTLPLTSWWRRLWLPTTAFGYNLGTPHRPQSSRTKLWCGWETKLRVIAAAGWGKSWRLLIPIIRQLPGPSVVTSIEGEIFAATVKARKLRLPPVRFEWMRHLRRKWRTPVKYPIYVVDMAKTENRMAAGFPQVRFNPIVGAEDFQVATKRARALVDGGDRDEDGSGTDRFFRESATQVLAAWLQAAALSTGKESKDIDDIVQWLSATDTGTPETLLSTATLPERGLSREAMSAMQTAIMNMKVHLDKEAGRTTSGVKRYLNFAISSMSTGPGRVLCGSRKDPQFDIRKMIRDEGTLYLLAEPALIATARPILTMLAGEVYECAEDVARSCRKNRLPRPFIGVHDELKAGIRQPILPYTASVQRKFGISYVYACQTGADELSLYGKEEATQLLAQSTWVIGGYDPASAEQIEKLAGRTRIVTPTRSSSGHRSESLHEVDVLPTSKQEQLADGYSVIRRRSVAPFLAHTPRVDATRRARRTISKEIAQVTAHVAKHRGRLQLQSRSTTDLTAYDLDPQASAQPSLTHH